MTKLDEMAEHYALHVYDHVTDNADTAYKMGALAVLEMVREIAWKQSDEADFDSMNFLYQALKQKLGLE